MKVEERQWVEIFDKVDSMMMKYTALAENVSIYEKESTAEKIQQIVINLGERIEKQRDVVQGIKDENEDILSEDYYDHYIRAYDNIVELMEQYCEMIYQVAIESNPDVVLSIKQLGGRIALALRFDLIVLSREALFPQSIRDNNVYDVLYNACIESGNVFPIQLGSTICHVKYRHSHSINDTAIVSQGPIDYQNNFTMETMYYYRSLYPGVKIIVSTWRGEVTEEFRWKMEAIGVDVLENDKPSDPGVFNIHMQFKSSRGGIELIENDHEIKYVLKTRNDQRFFHPDFLQYLRNLVIQYPAGNKARERIVYMGEINSMFTIPFRLTDFMLFGSKEMIRDYWSEDMEKRCAFKEPVLQNNDSVRYTRVYRDAKNFAFAMSKADRIKALNEIEGYQDPESTLARTFFEMYYQKDQDDKDLFIHYWEWLRDYVVIADAAAMEWFWDKYDYPFQNLSVNNNQGDLNYFAWLDLYLNGLKGVEI